VDRLFSLYQLALDNKKANDEKPNPPQFDPMRATWIDLLTRYNTIRIDFGLVAGPLPNYAGYLDAQLENRYGDALKVMRDAIVRNGLTLPAESAYPEVYKQALMKERDSCETKGTCVVPCVGAECDGSGVTGPGDPAPGFPGMIRTIRPITKDNSRMAWAEIKENFERMVSEGTYHQFRGNAIQTVGSYATRKGASPGIVSDFVKASRFFLEPDYLDNTVNAYLAGIDAMLPVASMGDLYLNNLILSYMEMKKLESIKFDSADGWNGVTSILSNSDPELKELFDASDPIIQGRMAEIPVPSMEDYMSQYTMVGEMFNNVSSTLEEAAGEVANLVGGDGAKFVVDAILGFKDVMSSAGEYVKHGLNSREEMQLTTDKIQYFIKLLSDLPIGDKTQAVVGLLDSLATLGNTVEQIQVYNANKQALLDAGVPNEFVSAYSMAFTKNITTGIADVTTTLLGVVAEAAIENGSTVLTIFEKGMLAVIDLNFAQAQIQATLKGKADYCDALVNTYKDEIKAIGTQVNLELMAMAYALEDTK
jgi:hypothetical protein